MMINPSFAVAAPVTRSVAGPASLGPKGTTVSPYVAVNKYPEFISDFDRGFYATGSTGTTFESLLTTTGASLKTMVDSDGLLKWAPHNLLTYSEDLTQGITGESNNAVITDFETITFDGTPSGYVSISSSLVNGTESSVTARIEVKLGTALPSIDSDISISIAGNSITNDAILIGDSISSDWQVFEVTSSGDGAGSQGSIRVQSSVAGTIFVRRWSLYRSDLGGMVNNPVRGDSYVPTTDSAKYLPRIGHHIYNGAEWVNEGVLVESEARTNLFIESQDFESSAWVEIGSVVSMSATGPDGISNSAAVLADDNSGGQQEARVDEAVTVAANSAYTVSIFAKEDQLSWLSIGVVGFTTPANGFAFFDLANAETGSADTGLNPTIQDMGNGWCRCAVTFTSDASDTSGTIRFNVCSGDGERSTIDSDGTSSILIYGAQFEEGSTPSSYIPTSGATATRAAETVTAPDEVLPWPEPNVIGDEQTPAFSTWAVVLTGTWAASGGGAYTFTDTVGGQTRPGAFWNQAILTAGKVYQAVIDVTSITGATQLRIDHIESSDVLVGAGQTSFVFVAGAAAASSGLRIRIEDTSTTINDGFALNSFSVREIKPLAVSIAMEGKATYSDNDQIFEQEFAKWNLDFNNEIAVYLQTSSTRTGQVVFRQEQGGTAEIVFSSGTVYSPGINVPFNIASRHGSTFINGAVDGTALTADTTPTALPDLSTTDLQIAPTFMGTIKSIRIWAEDIGDDGLVQVTELSIEPTLSLVFDSSEASFTSEAYLQ